MKHFIYILITFCIYSCKCKESGQIQEGIDYVLDSTLLLDYLDVNPFLESETEKEPAYEADLEKVFSMAKKDIQRMNIELFLPLKMHLHNDSIWIIRNGEPKLQPNEIYFGGGAYMEIRKSDGFVLKRILEE